MLKTEKPGDDEPVTAPTTTDATGISKEQDKRFQAMLRAKNLTFEDVFWIVCGDKCPTCDVTRSAKDAIARLAKLEKFAKDITHDRNHERNHPGDRTGDCDGPHHCIVCAAHEALK